MHWLINLRSHRHLPGALVRMTSTYKECLQALNRLQTNAAELERVIQSRQQNLGDSYQTTFPLLDTIGITQDKLTNLKLIHVSGTKGKGSTCAFIESMLRHAGHTTGFYSSPHLIEVRERIRINGAPISKELFAKYFRKTWSLLGGDHDETQLPTYFRFLTLMSFLVFVEEKIDVAVYEVGIGGRFDTTNVVEHPSVCATSSLGYDHINLLGDTIAKIAWQKGGIYKPQVPCGSVAQPEDGFAILQKCALDQGTSLIAVPSLDSYTTQSGEPIRLGLNGAYQKTNAALALWAVGAWLRKHQPQFTLLDCPSVGHSQPSSANALPFVIPPQLLEGLAQCRWPGRSQTLNVTPQLRYHVDGAHTPESCEVCSAWFLSILEDNVVDQTNHRILLFNCAGNRTAGRLLPWLRLVHIRFPFAQALFCPNLVSTEISADADSTNYMMDNANALKQVEANAKVWEELTGQSGHQFPSIKDAMDYVSVESTTTPVSCFVTGSLHLVGGVLSLLNEDVQ